MNLIINEALARSLVQEFSDVCLLGLKFPVISPKVEKVGRVVSKLEPLANYLKPQELIDCKDLTLKVSSSISSELNERSENFDQDTTLLQSTLQKVDSCSKRLDLLASETKAPLDGNYSPNTAQKLFSRIQNLDININFISKYRSDDFKFRYLALLDEIGLDSEELVFHVSSLSMDENREAKSTAEIHSTCVLQMLINELNQDLKTGKTYQVDEHAKERALSLLVALCPAERSSTALLKLLLSTIRKAEDQGCVDWVYIRLMVDILRKVDSLVRACYDLQLELIKGDL